MSVGSPNHGKDFSEFKRMETETLEEILRMDLEAPEREKLNVDTIIGITEILEERRKNDPSRSRPDVDQAWAEFNEKYRPYHFQGGSLYDGEDETTGEPSAARTAQGRTRRRIVRWIGTVAAALCIFLLAGTAAASAMGYDVWSAFAQWTGETFQFVRPPVERGQEAPEQSGGEFATLEDALADYDLSPNGLVPAWLPEGYELVSVQVEESPMYIKFLAEYKNDEQWFLIDIKYFEDNSASIHERDILNAEKYPSGGREYYIFSNEGKETVAWIEGQCECAMIGDLEKADLYKVIDSLHRE